MIDISKEAVERLAEDLDASIEVIHGAGSKSAVASIMRALLARVEELAVVLNRLEKETSGMLGAFEHELRPVIGNTNFHCLMEKVEKAREALKEASHD